MPPLDPLTSPNPSPVEENRTLQSYIDETPMWRDGTRLPVTPMTAMQWRIWWLAAAGKFFEGMVVFMTGVALPLIAVEYQMSELQHGLVSAASLFGILIGALFLGSLADQFGRKFMFIVEMIIFMVFLILLSISPGFIWVVIFLFGVGVALGCDYPTAHLIISESIPSAARGRLVLSAFAFQAVGALTGTLIGYLLLSNVADVTAWRWMYASAIIPAAFVVIARFNVPESAFWLLEKGRLEQAEREAARLLKRQPSYPSQIRLTRKPERPEKSDGSIRALFKGKTRRATILAAVPWFLQDLGTYGIGLFTPTILAAALGQASTTAHDLTDIIGNDVRAAEGAALIDLLLIVGICCAVVLSDKVGRIPLQVFGFIGCAAGLLIASFAQDYSGGVQTALIFIGFMLFNFMTNLGPNSQTYLLAGEVFPTRIRGLGAGCAAAFAKIGAVMTAFLFPIVLDDVGVKPLLYILVATSLAGAAITWLFRIETTGRSLDEIDG